VKLVNLAPKRPNTFKIVVKAKGWFSGARANKPAAETTVTVVVGSHCYSHVATLKVN
jgi:hypothetical protein